MSDNLRGVREGLWYTPDVNGGQWRKFEAGVIPDRLMCFQACWTAYRNVGAEYNSMPFSRVHAIEWFRQGSGDGPNRRLQTDIARGEPGDILFMGEPLPNQGHAVLVQSVAVSEDGRLLTIETIGQFGSMDSEDIFIVDDRTFTATKNEDGAWVFDNGQEFVGYGQVVQPGSVSLNSTISSPLPGQSMTAIVNGIAQD